MLKESNKKEFDLKEIQSGCAIRFQLSHEQLFRMGVITKVTETSLRVVYVQKGTNATAWVDISARDVDLGLWNIIYSKDLVETQFMGKPEFKPRPDECPPFPPSSEE